MATQSKVDQLKQVQGDIAAVRLVQSQSIAQVQGKFLGGDSAAHVVSVLKGTIEQRIIDWGNKGIDAALAGKPPAGNGWAGWTASGKVIVDGMNSLTDLGLNATLDAINATAVDTVKDVQTKAATIVHTTTTAVESAAHAVTGGLQLVLAIAGCAVVALFLLRRA